MNKKDIAKKMLLTAKSILAVGKKAPKGKYVVQLEAVPNPDFRKKQWQSQVNIKENYKPVRNLKEAQRECRKFIDKNELGVGNWSGGNIYNDKGDLVGYISYNGRAWKDDNWPSKEIDKLP